MKAIVYEKYGPPDVLQLKEAEKPVPGVNEVLIRVRATSVTTGDCNLRGFTFVPPGFGPLPRLMFGIRQPKRTILGVELAGEIEAVGKSVKSFKAGDSVFGIDSTRLGGYAEYACRPEAGALAIKPANMTFAQAAVVPFGAGTALFFLRDLAQIQNGQKVLIIGASGGVGTYAVQLARYFGAEVTGVCRTANLEWVKSLGAERVVDYTREDLTQNGEKYDIILDTVVGKTSFSRYKNSLSPRGRYLAVAGGLSEAFQMWWTSMTGGRKVLWGAAPEKKEDLLFLKALIEAGQIQAVIDRQYPLEQTAEAHRYADEGHKKGNVVISV